MLFLNLANIRPKKRAISISMFICLQMAAATQSDIYCPSPISPTKSEITRTLVILSIDVNKSH